MVRDFRVHLKQRQKECKRAASQLDAFKSHERMKPDTHQSTKELSVMGVAYQRRSMHIMRAFYEGVVSDFDTAEKKTAAGKARS